MRVCAVSIFSKASKEEVLSFLLGVRADFVLLPGCAENLPASNSIKANIQPGVHVFAETGYGKQKACPQMISADEVRQLPHQVFSARNPNSDRYVEPKASEIEELIGMLQERTITVCGRRVTVFLCGELHAFKPDGKLKYQRELPFPLDVTAASAHTLMGHWNHLGRKLRLLSQQSSALYATNNTSNNVQSTTDVRIYVRGERINKRLVKGRLAVIECVV